MRGLHTKPSFGGAAERPRKSVSHLRYDRTAARDHIVELLTTHAERFCGLHDRHAHFIEAVADHLARVWRVLHGEHLDHLSSVIIHEVQVKSLAILEAKDHTPVGPYGHRPP